MECVAQIHKGEVGKLSEIWTNVVVVYVVGQTPTIGTLIRFIALEWNSVAKPKVFLHEDEYFLVKFENIEERNEIFSHGTIRVRVMLECLLELIGVWLMHLG